MKITADQLLKIAGIAPTTTLRTRLNESVGGGAIYIDAYDGRLSQVPASEVGEYTKGLKAKTTPAGTAYRAEEYFIIVPSTGGGAIQIEYDGRINAVPASEVEEYTKGLKARTTSLGTLYTADEYYVFVPAGSVKESAGRRTRLQEATSKAELKRLQDEAKSISDKIDDIVEDGGTVSLTDPLNIKLRKVRAQIKKLKSVKEGMETKSDSLEYQFGGLGKAFEEHIYTMVDMLMDDEGFDPSTADVEDILNRVAEVIADIARDITGEQAARRAVTKALGQVTQSYDDEGRMSRQRQLDV